MQHKFRLLLTAGIAAILMGACGSETNENASVDENSVNTDEILVMEDSNEESDTENTTTSEEAETEEPATEDTSENELEDSEAPEAQEAPEEAESSEAKEEVEVPVKGTDENIEPIEQTAINRLVEATDITLEDYVFLFETTEAYVEITVREQTDAEVTPLVGIYRYMIETDEILINDYLTGEFIPYEKTE